MLGENDRFARFASNMDGINSANFRFDPRDPDASVVGFDQTPTGGTCAPDVYEAIKHSIPMESYGVARDVLVLLGSPKHVDPDAFGDAIFKAAKEQLTTMGQAIRSDEVRRVAAESGVERRIVDELLQRLAKYTS